MQIYNESWRQMRDFFYAKNMHGVDWQGVYDDTQFSDHFSDDISEVCPVIDMRNQDFVFFIHSLPIYSMHINAPVSVNHPISTSDLKKYIDYHQEWMQIYNESWPLGMSMT